MSFFKEIQWQGGGEGEKEMLVVPITEEKGIMTLKPRKVTGQTESFKET